jgi:hypothetical protein
MQSAPQALLVALWMPRCHSGRAMLRAWVCLCLAFVLLAGGALPSIGSGAHAACDHPPSAMAQAGHHGQAAAGHDHHEHHGEPAGAAIPGPGDVTDACHGTSAACPLCGAAVQSVVLRMAPLEHWPPTPANLGAITPKVHQRPPISV